MRAGRILSVLFLIGLLAFSVPALCVSAEPAGEKIVYGYSGAGRELCAYRYGDGENVLVMGFAIHGYEDSFPRDGECLVYTAEKLMEFLDTTGLCRERGWTVYVLPCMNPDGLYDGYSNNGPGRCTTTMLDSKGNLKENRGIDMNRSFPAGYSRQSGRRNYNGTKPLACLEAQALADFISDVMGTGDNYLVDTHGWYQQTITYAGKDDVLYQSFETHFPDNTFTLKKQDLGYFAGYAHQLGYDSLLLELPRGITSLEEFMASGIPEREIASVEDLLRTKDPVCVLNGHVMEGSREEPDCTRAGWVIERCVYCGITQKTRISPWGHAVVFRKQKPTCTEDGAVISICMTCGEELGSVPLLHTGHVLPEDGFVWLRPRSAGAAGLRSGVCTVCGKTVTQEVPWDPGDFLEDCGFRVVNPPDAEPADGSRKWKLCCPDEPRETEES